MRELARLHGGDATVASAPGKGSRFQVLVPFGHEHLPPESLQAASAVEPALPPATWLDEGGSWLAAGRDVPQGAAGTATTATAAPAVEAPRSVGRGTPAPDRPAAARRALVLVADDNADMRHYLRRLLEPEYDVATLADGRSDLAFCRSDLPDLIVSDVMMPGLDGFALLRAPRAEPATAPTPVILLSARAGTEARLEGLEAGADDYLVKPFHARELLARVKGVLDLTRLRAEAHERERTLDRALQESEARHRFLVRLDETLRRLDDPGGRRAGERADAERALRRNLLVRGDRPAGRGGDGRRPVPRRAELPRPLRPRAARPRARRGTRVRASLPLRRRRRRPAGRRRPRGVPRARHPLAPVRAAAQERTVEGGHGPGQSAHTALDRCRRRSDAQQRHALLGGRRARPRRERPARQRAALPRARRCDAADRLRHRAGWQPRLRESPLARSDGPRDGDAGRPRGLHPSGRPRADARCLGTVARDRRGDAGRVPSAARERRRLVLVPHALGAHARRRGPRAALVRRVDRHRRAGAHRRGPARGARSAAGVRPPQGRVPGDAGARAAQPARAAAQLGADPRAHAGPRRDGPGAGHHQPADRHHGAPRRRPARDRAHRHRQDGAAARAPRPECGDRRGDRDGAPADRGRAPSPRARQRRRAAPHRGRPHPPHAGVRQPAEQRRALQRPGGVGIGLSLAQRMACGGQEALAAFTRQPADLVLLDLGMPRMDGFEVARRPRLLDGGAGCLVVALSGWAQAADRQRSLEAGFDGHLAKPVDSDLFQDLLENGIRAATRSAGSTGA